MSVIRTVKSREIPDSFYSIRRLEDAVEVVRGILSSVRDRGDEAVRECASRFDRANPASFEVDPAMLADAEQKMKKDKPALYDALCLSRDLALSFAKRQRESFDDFESELSPGLITGQRTIAVDRAGLYVPGGRFPLFSSVIMCASPARAAGVGELVFCTPPVAQSDPALADIPCVDEAIMATASLCGITRVFAIGGAQAIGAMAYGTHSVPKVNVIVGPGNKYVAAAKKMVYGEVGIDLLAGPSEVFIIADGSADFRWVARDMLAQAEHDPDAQAVLVTNDSLLAERVEKELETLLEPLGSDSPAALSFSSNGWIILCESLDEAASIANRKAPEHLELALEAGAVRDALETTLRNYGSLFIGHKSAEVLGDYAAGLNHTLPTSSSALFTGGLSVRHFLKTVTTLRTAERPGSDVRGLNASLAAAALLADAEGLCGHALAARVRL